MTILSVIGARPQFVKAAVVSRAVRGLGIREILVHTGQHYDPEMSRVFFDELGIPRPDHNLDVGSGSHAVQTGAMMVGLERVIEQGSRPDQVLVYGDTNSTVAAALVASKFGIPIAHVEAGLRSFNRRMPEEINRIVTDRLSRLLFCPTQTAVDHLRSEGITEGVVLSGDVMLDSTRHFGELARGRVRLDSLTTHEAGSFALATIHRAENTDDPARLAGILAGLGRTGLQVILPIHPRTRPLLQAHDVPPNVTITEPVGYLSMLTLVGSARLVLTDSGGLQKEAVWLGTPCVTLREETEWVETLEGGWNQLVGADPDAIADAARKRPEGAAPEFGGAGGTSPSELIARTLLAA